jgi:hypothetical protein
LVVACIRLGKKKAFRVGVVYPIGLQPLYDVIVTTDCHEPLAVSADTLADGE